MLSRVSILLLAIFATQPAMGAKGARAQILNVVRAFENGDERGLLSLTATLELLNLRPSDRDRKRLWRDVPGSGVAFERRVIRMAIVRLSADRATVDARASSAVINYTVEGSVNLSEPSTVLDRIELRRTKGDWRIQSVARRIRK